MYGQRCHIINPYPIGISGFDLKQIIAGRYIHQTGRTIISKLYPLVIQSLNSIYVFYSRRVNIVQGSKSYSEITFIRLQVLSLIVTIYVLPARSIILINVKMGKTIGGTKSLLCNSSGIIHNAPYSDPKSNLPEDSKTGLVSAICI